MPESPHIRVYIAAYPTRIRVNRLLAENWFYLQIASFRRLALKSERLYRTQKVTGYKSLQMSGFALDLLESAQEVGSLNSAIRRQPSRNSGRHSAVEVPRANGQDDDGLCRLPGHPGTLAVAVPESPAAVDRSRSWIARIPCNDGLRGDRGDECLGSDRPAQPALSRAARPLQMAGRHTALLRAIQEVAEQKSLQTGAFLVDPLGASQEVGRSDRPSSINTSRAVLCTLPRWRLRQSGST